MPQFYNVPNPPNFNVYDPFAALQNDVYELQLEVDSLTGTVAMLIEEINNIENSLAVASGRTLFFNYPVAMDYQVWNKEQQFIGALLLDNSYVVSDKPLPSSSPDEFEIVLPAETSVIVQYATTPTRNMFKSVVNQGAWKTHLVCSTTSPQTFLTTLIGVAFEDNGAIDTFVVSPANNPTYLDQTGTAEYISTNIGSFYENTHPGTMQVYFVIYLTNPTSTTQTVTIYNNYNITNAINSYCETPLQDMDNIPIVSFAANTNLLNNPNDFYGRYIFPGSIGYFNDDDGLPNTGTVGFNKAMDVTNYFRFSTTNIQSGDIYSTFYALEEDGYATYMTIQNANNITNFLKADDDGYGFDTSCFNPGTQYRNFNYITYQTFAANDPSVNRMYISYTTGNNGTAYCSDIYCNANTFDSNDEYMYVNYSSSNADIQAYVVLYGATEEPLSKSELNTFFKTFVDKVMYNGATLNNINAMQTQFTSNFQYLEDSLPPLYPNFEFIEFNDCATINVSSAGNGNFRCTIAAGRQYFTPGEYNFYINNQGSNYAVNDTVRIDGTTLGGASPANDAFITITEVDGSGGVLNFTTTGNAVYLQNQSNISDGGDDQYDGGNYLYSQYTSLNYGDGSIRNGYYSPSSSFMVDYNKSIFVSIATNAYDNYVFYIDGNMGSDGRGQQTLDNGWFNFYFAPYEDNWGISGVFEQGQVYSLALDNDYTTIRSLREARKTRTIEEKVAKSHAAAAKLKAKREQQMTYRAKVGVKSVLPIEDENKSRKKALRVQQMQPLRKSAKNVKKQTKTSKWSLQHAQRLGKKLIALHKQQQQQ